jgi:fermentation-respiration switch protein FrsA (DUF1100 family)/ketosteroid isomerase-like protein
MAITLTKITRSALGVGALSLACGALATVAQAAEPSSSSASGPRVSKVAFRSGSEKMVGNLYLPSNHRAGTRLPSVVIAGPWLNVKEQVAANYARKLAGQGLAAFIFDFRHWGESGGQPREVESPRKKIEDIRSAVAWMKTSPAIDPGRIGALGICFGAGYVAEASVQDPSIHSLATVAAWLHTKESQLEMFGPDEVARRRRAGREAREAWEKQRRTVTVPAASNTERQAAMFNVDYYTEPGRGTVPQWTNRFAVMSWEEYMDFDGLSRGARIAKPLAVVHSDGSGLPPHARAFYEAARGPKQLVWLQGNHTDFYDREPHIATAANAVASHFRQTLLSDADKNKIRQSSLAGTREFFSALEALNILRFLKVWAPDGVQEMPYAPPGFPQRLAGRAAIEKQYGPLPTAFDGMKFPIKSLRATDDPNVVLAEYDGSIGLKSGARYDNRYVGVFTFNGEGKLAHYAEYFDPFTLINGFPGAREATLSDDERIRRAVSEMARAADARDWSAIRATFADEVDFDYTSVAGGQPARLKADAIVAGWTQGLGRYKQTKHHFSTPEVKIEGETATATFTGQATHVRDDNGQEARWSCGGDYTYRFARSPQGWKATSAKFSMKWEQGTR